MEASPKRITAEELSTFVSQVMNETPIVDMHTHLYSEEFGDIGLWGVDELINRSEERRVGKECRL